MPLIITGNSMEPTLQSGQIAGVNKLAYLSGPPRRGEIVIVWTGREFVVKRVVGLPGEVVAAHNGFFSIDGRPLEEPYVQFQGLAELASGRIEADCYVIAGDNRAETFIGIVHRRRIVGRLMVWRNSLQPHVEKLPAHL
jgi:signal peptidase I